VGRWWQRINVFLKGGVRPPPNITSHNRRYTLRRLGGGSGSEKGSRARAKRLKRPLCHFLHHSLPTLQTQKQGKNRFNVFAFAYTGWQTVVYLERYAQCTLKLLEMY